MVFSVPAVVCRYENQPILLLIGIACINGLDRLLNIGVGVDDCGGILRNFGGEADAVAGVIWFAIKACRNVFSAILFKISFWSAGSFSEELAVKG